MVFENYTVFMWTYSYEICLGLCSIFLALIIAMAKVKDKSKFPPGPKGLPIVGYLPFLSQYKHLDFIKLGKKYGDIFSIRLGSQNAVIMHGGDAVIESLNNPNLFGRSPNVQNAKLRPTSLVLGNDFYILKEHRKFVINSMKNLGLGKAKLEQDILDEIKHFISCLKSFRSQPRDVNKELFSSITNNMITLVFGKKLTYKSAELDIIHDKIRETFKYFVPVPKELAFSWLRYIPFSSKFLQTRKLRALNDACENIYRKEIKNHKETLDSSHVRDFIDLYLMEIHKRKEKNTETCFNHDILLSLVRDLANAGSETVYTSMSWLLYVIAAFPEVQKKVQSEIKNVIGSEKTPELMDMKNMPYTHAVLLETLRWQTTAPLSVPRFALNDCIVGGYLIPKGTVVFHNLWAVHHDLRYWEEPDIFKPERFLSSDGKFVVKSKYLLAFSRGGRGCPGESMAILVLFLYCISILKEFNVTFSDGTKPTFKAICTLTYQPEPYLLRFIPLN